jgi:putative SOS response-associated peptidase YedK
MCGRFTLTASIDTVRKTFNCKGITTNASTVPHYNLAPSQSLPVIFQNKGSQERELALMHWGLIPSWSNDFETPYSTINAKAETITKKPLFRPLLFGKRCLVPSDGFYEWESTTKAKQPWRFTLKGEKLFAFAGLWDEFTEKETHQKLKSFTIITTEPNEVVAPVHNRMPVILPPEQYSTWLDPSFQDTNYLLSLLVPYPSDEMISYRVSRRVSNPRFDDSECVAPLNEGPFKQPYT